MRVVILKHRSRRGQVQSQPQSGQSFCGCHGLVCVLRDHGCTRGLHLHGCRRHLRDHGCRRGLRDHGCGDVRFCSLRLASLQISLPERPRRRQSRLCFIQVGLSGRAGKPAKLLQHQICAQDASLAPQTTPMKPMGHCLHMSQKECICMRGLLDLQLSVRHAPSTATDSASGHRRYGHDLQKPGCGQRSDSELCNGETAVSGINRAHAFLVSYF